MGTMTLAPVQQQEIPRLPALATPAPARRWPGLLGRFCRRVEVWYAGFAIYAAGMAMFSGPGVDHYWGIWACGGYGVAAALSWRWPGRNGRAAALAAAVAGALAGPAAWLAVCAPATPDTTVVSRAGLLLPHHGSPYLGGAQLAHGGFLAYNPYLPVMAVFGLPHALGLPGLAGAAARFAAVALGSAAALVVALTPAAFTSRASLTATVANTVAYPLGLTRTPSPAQSPLPGHLLTTLGPAGTPPPWPCWLSVAWLWPCPWWCGRQPQSPQPRSVLPCC